MKIRNLPFILVATCTVLLAAVMPAQAAEAKKPNILVIMGDDIGI